MIPNNTKNIIPESTLKNVYPTFLLLLLIIITALTLTESYFQLKGTKFSFLNLAHEYGFLQDYDISMKPSRGIWHPLGWIGSACFILMMFYSFRKKIGFMQDVGQLRYWLDTHMFLGIVGTVLIGVHSTFKFGGIVSISFWSMVLVTISGFFGRYIYIKIPRSISGNELRADEIEYLVRDINKKIDCYSIANLNLFQYFERITVPEKMENIGLIQSVLTMIYIDIVNIIKLMEIRLELRKNLTLSPAIKKELSILIKEKGKLIRSTNFFSTSHRILHYWHVFHKPFAFIMFLIMFLHIIVYKIFHV